MKKDKAKKEKKKRSPFRRFGWGAFLPILMTAALGVLIFALPEGQSLPIAVGVILAVTGALSLIGAFLSGRFAFVQLIFGVAEIALAVWLFVTGDGALAALMTVFAVILLLRALCGIWGSFAAQRSGGSWWKIQVVGSLLIAVFAVVMLFDPFAVEIETVLVGVFLLLDAGLELLSMLRGFFVKDKKKEEPAETEKDTYQKEKDV